MGMKRYFHYYLCRRVGMAVSGRNKDELIEALLPMIHCFDHLSLNSRWPDPTATRILKILDWPSRQR
jgi:hypothetical protein